MPPVIGKRFKSQQIEAVAKGPRKTESTSTEPTSPEMHMAQSTESVKGSLLSAFPIRRRRGRPRKAEVEARQVAVANGKEATVHSDAKPGRELKTRSGRVVKRTVKTDYD
jgi:hypothetical protein